MLGCDRGLDASNQSTITLEADESINITAKKDGIRTKNNSVVFVGQTAVPIANTVFITSNREIGIRSFGDSSVVIDPQLTCAISGAKAAIRENDSSSIDTDGCTLVGG